MTSFICTHRYSNLKSKINPFGNYVTEHRFALEITGIWNLSKIPNTFLNGFSFYSTYIPKTLSKHWNFEQMVHTSQFLNIFFCKHQKNMEENKDSYIIIFQNFPYFSFFGKYCTKSLLFKIFFYSKYRDFQL